MPDPRRISPRKMADFELRHWRSLPSRRNSLRRPPALVLHSNSANGPRVSPSGYISIRDLIVPSSTSPSMIQSPTADEIGISNRLVKHAAFAYLQPTPSAYSSSSSSSRRCRSLRRALASCFGFLARLFCAAVHRER